MYKPVCRGCFFKEQEAKKRLVEVQVMATCESESMKESRSTINSQEEVEVIA